MKRFITLFSSIRFFFLCLHFLAPYGIPNEMVHIFLTLKRNYLDFFVFFSPSFSCLMVNYLRVYLSLSFSDMEVIYYQIYMIRRVVGSFFKNKTLTVSYTSYKNNSNIYLFLVPTEHCARCQWGKRSL